MKTRLFSVLAMLAITVVAAMSVGVARADAISCSVRDFSSQAPVVHATSVTVPAAESTCDSKYMVTFGLQFEDGGVWHNADGSSQANGGYDWCANASGVHDNPFPTSWGCQSIPNEFTAGSHHVTSATGNGGDPQMGAFVAPYNFCLWRWRSNHLVAHHINTDGSMDSTPDNGGPSVIAPVGC